jgi:hypothetical protein
MSVPNAGLAAGATSVEAEDPVRGGSVVGGLDKDVALGGDPGPLLEDDHPIAPDQFDPKFETSKAEIWSYYCYYIGNK